MGVDMMLYAVGDITDDEIEAAHTFLGAWRFDFGCALRRARTYHDDGPRVEWWNGYRYYGPGYERGHWPSIYACIRGMRAAFPHATVFYGPDTAEDGSEATDEYLEELWAHWLSEHGDDVYKPREPR